MSDTPETVTTPPMAVGATEISKRILKKSGKSREDILLDSILSKKEVPEFMHVFAPVHAYGKHKVTGDDVVIEYQVSVDYLSVGTNLDFLRVPLCPKTAQKVADDWNCILPCKRMVDQIYAAGTVILNPQPISPKPGEPGREASETFLKHNGLVQNQIGTRTYQGLLVVGHKKDVVISSQLPGKPGKVAIYGWHQKSNKKPIQPLFLGHGEFYVDYSHGIRLVKKDCLVNGVQNNIENVLKDKDLAHILTGTGPMPVTRYKL